MAATIWTGGHLILFFTVLLPTLRDKNIDRIRAFERRYEKIGIPALLVLVLTGLYLAWRQEPEFARWFSAATTISRTIMVKLSLLASTAVLAVHARLFIIPSLSKETLFSLALHITLVTMMAVLFALTGLFHRFGSIW